MRYITFLILTIVGAPILIAQTDRVNFIEGKIHITLPVRLLKTGEGYIAERNFNDGGTQMFTIIDAEGKATDVYIDYRIDKKENRGTIYVNAYPDDPGSIRVKDQAFFREKILKPLGI
jgi:hypothetical protein